MLIGFQPIAAPGARVLVLGSMPSVASLAAQQYYGHPRNAFWPLIEALFGVPRDAPYAERCARLAAHRVAVWDVLAACRREGSLDAAIEPGSIEVNDFQGFLAGQPGIAHVFFNGGTAEAVFRRRVLPGLGARAAALALARLPSTSPAHAGRSLEQKLAVWRALLDALGGPA